MKQLIIFAMILGLSFMLSCGNDETIETSNLIDQAPAAPSQHGTLEYIQVPSYDLVERNGTIQTLLSADEVPSLDITAIRIEEGSRGDVLVRASVVDESTIYSNYPVRVRYHPSINVHTRPLTYSDGRGNDVFLTDDQGSLELVAASRTGHVTYMTLDIGGYEYKVQFGSTEDD